eukprot:417433-Rhodomonas_salina.1
MLAPWSHTHRSHTAHTPLTHRSHTTHTPLTHHSLTRRKKRSQALLAQINILTYKTTPRAPKPGASQTAERASAGAKPPPHASGSVHRCTAANRTAPPARPALA